MKCVHTDKVMHCTSLLYKVISVEKGSYKSQASSTYLHVSVIPVSLTTGKQTLHTAKQMRCYEDNPKMYVHDLCEHLPAC